MEQYPHQTDTIVTNIFYHAKWTDSQVASTIIDRVNLFANIVYSSADQQCQMSDDLKNKQHEQEMELSNYDLNYSKILSGLTKAWTVKTINLVGILGIYPWHMDIYPWHMDFWNGHDSTADWPFIIHCVDFEATSLQLANFIVYLFCIVQLPSMTKCMYMDWVRIFCLTFRMLMFQVLEYLIYTSVDISIMRWLKHVLASKLYLPLVNRSVSSIRIYLLWKRSFITVIVFPLHEEDILFWFHV